MPTCYAEDFLNILALVFTEIFLLNTRERGAKIVQADSLYPATAWVRKFHSSEQKFAFSDIFLSLRSPLHPPPHQWTICPSLHSDKTKKLRNVLRVLWGVFTFLIGL